MSTGLTHRLQPSWLPGGDGDHSQSCSSFPKLRQKGLLMAPEGFVLKARIPRRPAGPREGTCPTSADQGAALMLPREEGWGLGLVLKLQLLGLSPDHSSHLLKPNCL